MNRSWKQTAAEAIVTHEAPVSTAPVCSPSIEELEQAGREFARRCSMRADTFAATSSGAAFDIADKLRKFGSYRSEAQQRYAANLVGWSKPKEPTERNYYLMPRIAATVSLAKFAKLTVKDLVLSIKYDGSVIWVKWQGVLAGRINPVTGGFSVVKRGNTDAQDADCLKALLEVEANPKGAAAAHGILTGKCACCGLPLTNELSIERGIGPICWDKF